MNGDLARLSPLAAYLGSFLDGNIPVAALILAAAAMHWCFLLVPPVLAIGFVDRKLGADIQMRIGPNRVSRFGLLQPLADFLKLFFKEDACRDSGGGWLFGWGVVGAIACVFVAQANIPMAERWALASPDSGAVGALFALLFSNLCLFWAAHSVDGPYSALAANRILSMIAAYIVPLALALVSPVLIAGSPNLESIVAAQGGAPWRWIAFHDPGALLSGATLFLALLIWLARPPFDHASAQAEVAGGLASQYSGIRKGLVAFLEYASLFLVSSFVVTLYLGGWQTPFNVESLGRAAELVQCICFMAKTLALALLSIWGRWSLPRTRIDQVLGFSWRVLVPMGLAGAALSAVWLVALEGKGLGEYL